MNSEFGIQDNFTAAAMAAPHMPVTFLQIENTSMSKHANCFVDVATEVIWREQILLEHSGCVATLSLSLAAAHYGNMGRRIFWETHDLSLRDPSRT